jgi:hypothetical protein
MLDKPNPCEPFQQDQKLKEMQIQQNEQLIDDITCNVTQN